MNKEKEPIIEITDLSNIFGDQVVHNHLNFKVYPGEVIAIIGGSGSGKTTLLRCILMLTKPTSGTIKLFGKDVIHESSETLDNMRKRFGVMFQHSALFSSMNVLENIMYPIQTATELPKNFIEELSLMKLKLVGLDENVGNKYPSELSGGMQRRVAAARAISMDPEVLFLDEPTTGLDPISARHFDNLLIFLHKSLKLTMLMISHDLESLKKVPDKIAFIGDGKVLACEPYEKLINNPHPLIADYFNKR